MGLGPRASTVAFTTSLIALLAAAPAAAATLTVTDITAGDVYALTVPSLEAVDTNMTEAQIRSLFAGDFAGNAAALATLDAATVTIPEIRMTYEMPGANAGDAAIKTTIVFRDTELSGVVDGVAASASIGSAGIEGGGGVAMNVGPMSAATFDIGALLSFYGIGDRPDSENFATIYSDFSVEGGSFTGPGFSCEIGGATLERFEARPLQMDFNEFGKLVSSIKPGEEPDAATVHQMIEFYADVLTSYKSTPMLLGGFNCSGSEGTTSVAAASGDIEIGGFSPNLYPHFSISDFNLEVSGPDAGIISLGNFTWKEMDFTAPIEALRNAPVELNDKWFEDNWRKLIPAIAGLSLRDVVIDVPNPDQPGTRVQGKVGAFDITLADYINGIPSNISASTKNFTFAIPAGEATEMALALGIETVDLGYDLRLHWDRAAGTIVIENVALDGADLGTIAISATLGNATEALFSADNAQAEAALMGLTVKNLTVNLDDRGLSALIVGVAAASENQDPSAMRLGISSIAQAVVLQFLGGTAEAAAAAQGIGSFVSDKNQLSLSIVAKDDGGLTMLDLMQAEKDPSVLAGKITVSATASGESRPADVAIALPAPPEDTSGDAATPDDGAQSGQQTEKETLKN